MKTHMKTFESTTTYMETDFKQKYDTIMSDKLHELRDEFEEEADNIRNEVESNHKEKVNSFLFSSFDPEPSFLEGCILRHECSENLQMCCSIIRGSRFVKECSRLTPYYEALTIGTS